MQRPHDQRGENSGSALSGALLCVLGAAGIAGALGVGLAAVAAHKVESPALATASVMLILHAAAALALAAVAGRSRSPEAWVRLACVMLAAALLFSGDIALHTLWGAHIFPMAAPSGGSLLIVSWAGVALLALLEWRRQRR